MEKIMILENDGSTGKEILREMNAKELAQWEIDKTQIEIKNQELAQKIAQKDALLIKLGITAEEAKLLLS